MPDTDIETKSKVIAGESFQVSTPYTEGHTITAIEAKVLNQVRAENIGNNMRQRVKELIEAGDIKTAQTEVADYDGGYEFTAGAAGAGRTRLDPVEKEARKIARDLVKAAAAAQGKKLSDFDKEYINDKVAEYAELDEVVKEAKKVVNSRAKLSEQALEGVTL